MQIYEKSLIVCGMLQLTGNGPAIWGGCVPAFSPKKRDGTCFCSPGTNLAEHYECRGTSYLTNG